MDGPGDPVLEPTPGLRVYDGSPVFIVPVFVLLRWLPGMLRRTLRLTLCVLAFGVLGACTIADLRTREVLEVGDRGAAERKGRELLEKAVVAAGGRDRWQSFSRVEMDFEDEWRGFLGWWFRPWPGNPTKLHVRYGLGMGSVQVRFLDGPDQGSLWGLDQGGFWRTPPKGARVYQRRESARFILRAYQFFFELPFQITKADIVLYAGERVRADRTFDLVFATWGRETPHAAHDQYLLWIARDSGLLEMAQYTIRDRYDFATGVNRFSDFRRVQGLLLPHAYKMAQDPEDPGFVHRAQLKAVVFHR